MPSPGPGSDFDHLFICTPAGPTDTEPLIAAGLARAGSRVHAGQGTANALFFFDNAYLELLWLHDGTEVAAPAVAPTSLPERLNWQETGACPFGVALRCGEAGDPLPPPVWRYEAPFLPAGASIPVLTPPHRPSEPFLFVMERSVSPAAYPADRRVPPEQVGTRRVLQSVHLTGPGVTPRENRIGLGRLVVARGAEPHMHLEFDPGAGRAAGKKGKGIGGEGRAVTLDFRPRIPLTISWAAGATPE